VKFSVFQITIFFNCTKGFSLSCQQIKSIWSDLCFIDIVAIFKYKLALLMFAAGGIAPIIKLGEEIRKKFHKFEVG